MRRLFQFALATTLLVAVWFAASDARAHQWWRYYPYGPYDVVVSPEPPIYTLQAIYPRRLVFYAEGNNAVRVYRPMVYYRGPLILRAR